MNDNFARPDNDNYFDEVNRLADELGIDEDDAIGMVSGPPTEAPAQKEVPDAPYAAEQLGEIEALYHRIISDENLDKPESPPALEDLLKWAGEWVIEGVRAVVYGSWERHGFITSKRYDVNLKFNNVTEAEKQNAPARYSDFDL